jgi:hypothetical protein
VMLQLFSGAAEPSGEFPAAMLSQIVGILPPGRLAGEFVGRSAL